MDWKNAKTVIIIVLLLTNLFILLMYAPEYLKEKSTDADASNYTVKLLEENGIDFQCQIPENPGKMHSLTVSYGKYDKSIVENVISQSPAVPADSRNQQGYSTAADSLLKKCGYLKEGTKLIGVDVSDDGRGATVSYKNYYRDTPLEECYMKVLFEDGRIIDFERKWMEFVEESDGRSEVMSPLSALLYYMNYREDEGPVNITDMYICYWIDDYDVEGDVLYDTALPAWCICLDTGEQRYVTAIS